MWENSDHNPNCVNGILSVGQRNVRPIPTSIGFSLGLDLSLG